MTDLLCEIDEVSRERVPPQFHPIRPRSPVHNGFLLACSFLPWLPLDQIGAGRNVMPQIPAIAGWWLLPRWAVRIPNPAFTRGRHMAFGNRVFITMRRALRCINNATGQNGCQ